MTVKALSRTSTKLAESVNNRWRTVAPRGTTREDLIQSDLWSVVSADFLPYDHVTVVAEDRSFLAEMLCLEAGRGYASMVELSFVPLPTLLVSNEGLPPGFDIFHAGPEKLYCVKRLNDNVIMGEGFPNKQAALEFLTDHATLR